LVRQQLREARTSSVLAALATSAAIGFVHAWFPGPAAVSEASALAIGVLCALWTLYFASDSFAGDSSSGRLSTLSVLPVASRTLWASRLCFVVFASLAQSVWAIVVGYAAQLTFGDARSLEHFESGLDSYAPWAFALPVLASAALLASLVVESALAAMFAALLALGCLALSLWVARRALALAGADLTVLAEGAPWGGLLAAAALLVLGAFVFARGQRRLGSRRVRARAVLVVVTIVSSGGGLAAAAYVRSELTVDLTEPDVYFCDGASNQSERWVALEVWRYGRSPAMRGSVWMFDLDSGARQELAAAGALPRDPWSNSPAKWSSEQPLRVVAADPLGLDPNYELITVHASTDGLAITRAVLGRRVESLVESRAAPWAQIVRSPRSSPVDWVAVRWGDREVRFDGEQHFVRALPSILPTPEPGKILVRRGDSLRIHDMRDSSERVVLDSGVSTLLEPSPDRSAVLVKGPTRTHVLDAASGDPLHADWPSSEYSVGWCRTSGAERVVHLRPRGSAASLTRIIDLDTGVEFDVERHPTQILLLRVAQRGYVFVRADGDLVLVDLRGRLVKVLVER
jgi:hypothetical protein